MATSKLTSEQSEQKIDAFFTDAPAFAKPICEKIRIAIATADPALKPTWKWNTPVYEKAGPGMVCAMSAHKQHVNLAFFQGALLQDPHNLFSGQDAKGMRTIRFTDVSQVNEPILVEYVRAAAQLKAGTAAKTTERSVIEIPEDLKQALAEAQQLEKFEGMAYTHRKEYVRWVTEAKRTETRDSRILKTVERITEGKKFS
ncbi:DUF1801 domain-containing protein [Rufibacter latericius]|uniref:YdhG-like domain-containing protein n=1 Tax=Rufibacter latericius TaxID=2487040 RepID=A0A3M9MW32_9BACT|nr:DUF1801 domain-containing protein [Rufibacter latericius]RNI29317.1 hypothetical protein EFB08_07820 [Rufibacter latericius]